MPKKLLGSKHSGGTRYFVRHVRRPAYHVFITASENGVKPAGTAVVTRRLRPTVSGGARPGGTAIVTRTIAPLPDSVPEIPGDENPVDQTDQNGNDNGDVLQAPEEEPR